ncbi:MAG: hypothetical protein ACO4B5_09875 [Steroidobacteraceae bacterium]
MPPRAVMPSQVAAGTSPVGQSLHQTVLRSQQGGTGAGQNVATAAVQQQAGMADLMRAQMAASGTQGLAARQQGYQQVAEGMQSSQVLNEQARQQAQELNTRFRLAILAQQGEEASRNLRLLPEIMGMTGAASR